MRPLTLAQRSQIISLLDTHHSGKEISRRMGVSTGAISKVRSEHQSSLPKSTGGRPSKLSSADIAYAKRIIRMRKADNAKQVMKVLKNVTNQTLSSQTVRRHLRKTGLRPVVKKKRPFLKPAH